MQARTIRVTGVSNQFNIWGYQSIGGKLEKQNGKAWLKKSSQVVVTGCLIRFRSKQWFINGNKVASQAPVYFKYE